NVIDVLAGVFPNALLGFRDELVPFAKLGRARGTNFRAGGWLSGGDAVRTHRAFLHPGQDFAPFVLRHAEGTGHHAVAATHALDFVVSDRAQGRLFQSAHGADRSASRFLTIHAQAPHEFVTFSQHHREFVIGLL